MEENKMTWKDPQVNIPVKNLITEKFDKLTVINSDSKGLVTEEGFGISFEYAKDLGKEKNIDMLTISVTYKTVKVYTTAIANEEHSRFVLDWFYKKEEELFENDDEIYKRIEDEGVKKLNEL